MLRSIVLGWILIYRNSICSRDASSLTLNPDPIFSAEVNWRKKEKKWRTLLVVGNWGQHANRLFLSLVVLNYRDLTISSVRRASDWRSEGPRFKFGGLAWVLNNPGSRHCTILGRKYFFAVFLFTICKKRSNQYINRTLKKKIYRRRRYPRIGRQEKHQMHGLKIAVSWSLCF